MAPHPETLAILDALDDPAMLVEGDRVIAANQAARNHLGPAIVNHNVRLAIRQPDALKLILSGRNGLLETTGIGRVDLPWMIRTQVLTDKLVFVRLIDRSPTRTAEKMRVDFVANASHELRTPLTTITGYAETLSEDGDFDADQRIRFASIIADEARRMLRIVEDLMSLSRIEADRFLVPKERVSIAEVATLAGSHGRELADRNGCHIAVEIEEGLPEISGDFGQLLQMLDNLVANAIRYGCGPDSCEVTIAAERVRDQVLLSVNDQGDGIPPQHLPRLTERFYRVDETRSRDSGGTGLGLAIVKHIVERHRGRLEIGSTVGSGTSVRVSLPIR